MYVIVWRFRPRPGCEGDFERAYGPSGTWSTLFGRASGFKGTDLLRSTDGSGDYLTLDHWESKADHDAFLEQWACDYARLDRELEALTEAERPLGIFERTGDATARRTDEAE